MPQQEKTGVQFVAEDIKKYLRAFADANKAMNEQIDKIRELVNAHGKAEKSQKSFSQTLMKMISGLKTGVGAVLGFAGVIGKVLGGALKVVLAPFKLFLGSLRRMAEIAGGFVLGSAIRGLANLINDLQKAVINSAADFEQLEVRMQNMIARAARLSGAISDVTKSFELSEAPARRLMGWVEEMSLIAPIDPEAITTTLTFAQTMNLTTEGAKELTESVLQFTTAMGFSSEVSERIIVNLLQMQKQGKITGREMTDLARGAMVPVNDILRDIAEQTGKSTENWNAFVKDVKAGRVPVEDFLNSFKKVIARDFPEAFERMSNTLRGSVQRLKNWAKTVLGFRVLGPVTQEIGQMIGAMVDQLSQKKIRNIASALGQVLLKAFQEVRSSVVGMLEAVKELGETLGIVADDGRGFARAIATIAAFMVVGIDRVTAFINELRGDLREQFQGSAEEAHSWGRNIIIQLASGMAQAISFVLGVIAQIGNLLKEWFAPGSPPKIAPDLDVWGAEAMTEYMKGWLKVDFSIFGEISDLIENFIRSLPTDILGEKSVIPSILGTREAITKAINMVRKAGEVTSEMVNRVLNSVPNATKAFRKYVRVTLELADAQAELEEVQKEQKTLQDEINEINNRYGDILDDLHKKLQRNMQVFDDQNKLEEINKNLASGRLTEEEQARLEAQKRDIQLREQIRTAEDQRDAELESREARLVTVDAEVKAAQDRVNILTEQKGVQEALIGAQIEYNNLIKEQIALLKKAAGGEDDGGGITLPTPAIPDLSQELDEIAQFDFETMFADAKASIEGIFDDIGEQFTGITEDLNAVGEAWNGFFGEAGTGAQMAEDIRIVIGALADAIRWITQTSITIKELDTTARQALFLLEHWPEVVRIIIAREFEKIKQIFISTKNTIFEVFTSIYNWLVGNSIVPDMMNKMKSIISGGLDFISSKFTSIKDSVVGTVQSMANNVKSSIVSSFQSAKSKAQSFAADIRGIWSGLKSRLVDNSIVPDMMRDIEMSIGSGLDNSTKEMKTWANEAVKSTQSASQGIAGAVSAVQNQTRQSVPQAMVAQPASVSNSRTTNVTVNANYQNQQSPADINMDVQAALVAAQL